MSGDFHRGDLERLRNAGRYRSLTPRTGIDFASNDYLGLANDQRLRDAVAAALDRGLAVGSGGSRLLRGNDPEIATLEAEAAAMFRAEAALFFSTGFAANVALLATLPQPGDLIVHDALIHASVHDGLKLSRAPSVAAAHNDAQAVDDAIASWRGQGGAGTPWIAVESLYSMDGDRAPIAALAEVAARHDAMLIIDEAHATGIWGNGGRGLAATLEGQPNIITLHTCGKALGCEGALVCGARVFIDFLVNRARPFIFSTAPSPLMAAAVREALRIVADEPARRETLHWLIAHAERVLAPLGVTPTGSQVLPLIVGGDAETMARAAALQAKGFDVRGIRPPTVPAGTARLRISLTLNVTQGDIDRLADALK
ncbi:8-amino-7-oxononanoate synthase [Sphingomonas koreensis]|uniref:8-amino-7-oxononanoate synthase n=1 Tax=Sphingomonas koreensis TaxID=93064 RepID=UPI00082EC27A|nr:8-amino-7-oxononanoate synthase [Sphingomonas koreensis]PJI90338.1 8-amino-7-oxononanoate synthase [Sphingomonas koreensis]RSU61195.1 8-amino-7-oxononanoate synthase [Sphingomonas koreensis]RSU69838.1 8-amino-7-oxononanoate synthase [Sphingomonas koreensis]